MKKTILMLLIGMGLMTAGCTSNTYSRLRDKEDKLIANYISRNGLQIIEEEPAENHQWGEKEYYKVKGYDNLYFHLISRGDTVSIDTVRHDTVDMKIVANDLIIMRYKRFDLTENPDTLDYWTTLEQAYPTEFHYYNTTECECVAWHLAVIVPSKLGFSTGQNSVTPYVYILKIKVKP